MKTNHTILIVLLCSCILSQDIYANQKNDSIKLIQKFEAGIALNNAKKFDSAAMVLLPISKFFQLNNMTTRYLNSVLELNYAYVNLDKTRDALNTLNSALKYCENQDLPNDNWLSKLYKERGRINYEKGKYKEAERDFQESMQFGIKYYGDTHEKIASLYNHLGNTYRHLSKLDESLSATQKAVDIAEKVLSSDDPDFSGYYHSLAYIYYKRSNPKEAIKYYNKSLNLRLMHFGENNRYIADSYLNLGATYEQMGNYLKALEYNEMALKIYKSLYGNENNRIASVYNNAGMLLRKVGDKVQSKLYHEAALDIKKKLFGDDHPVLSKYYYNLGISFEWEGNYAQALELYQKSLDIDLKAFGENHPEVAGMYATLGMVQHEMGNDDLAENLIKKGLKIQLNIVGSHHHHTPAFYSNLAEINLSKNENSLAHDNLMKAVQILKDIHGKYHPEIALAYNDLASIAVDENDYQKGMYYADLAYGSLNPNINELISSDDEAIKDLPQKDELITIMGMKAKISLAQYDHSAQVSDLLDAYESYQLAINTMGQLRNDFYLKNAILHTPGKFMDIYEGGIDTSLKLYRNSGNIKYYDQAFMISEKSKAVTLMANLKDNYAKHFAGVPDNILDKEQIANTTISFLTNRLFEAENNENEHIGKTQINQWRKELLLAKLEKDSIVDLLETHYKDYYQLKYDNHYVSVTDIQKDWTHDGQVLVAYFLGRNKLFIFGVTDQELVAESSDIPDNFSENIHFIRKFINEKNSDIAAFKTTSHQLYQTLIEPVEQVISDKRITLISDGLLGYLPFELLLYSDDSNEENNFKSLNYLIKRNQINYAFSFNHLFKSILPHSMEVENYLAFAPSFGGGENQNDLYENQMLLASNDRVRASLAELKGTSKEIESISKYTTGQFYEGSKATESLFKSSATGYGIIHLATHAIVDDRNPMNSRLLFTKNEDSLEDGNLYTWELYNMKLNARMAILSACNTGYGSIQRGEGVMSLGRAFAYAGCPSIVMSLWPAQDETTAEIMNYFYEYLSQGINKDESMRKAKLDFLENKDELFSHPFYWASFITQGDPQPITFKEKFVLWPYILAMSFTFFLGFVLLKKPFKLNI